MQEIYLIDEITGDFSQIDVEENVMEIKYQVADLSDIEARKDTITKNLTLKNTNKNNYVLGNLFHLNRYVSDLIVNKIFSNYNPIRQVKCLVYENNLLILNGYFQISDIKKDKKGNIIYSAIISGSIAPIKSKLDDKMLTDLDFSFLKHYFNKDAIIDSWGGKYTGNINTTGQSRMHYLDTSNVTQYINVASNREDSNGYVYTYIDYADKFVSNELTYDYSVCKVQNYRPSLFVLEVLFKIFEGIGYKFDKSPVSNRTLERLIIPDTNSNLFTTKTGVQVRKQKGIAQNISVTWNSTLNSFTTWSECVLRNSDAFKYVIPIIFSNNVITDNSMLIESDKKYPYQNVWENVTFTSTVYRYNNVFRVTSDMMTSIQANINLKVKNNNVAGNNPNQKYYFQIVKRKGTLENVDDSTDYDDFEILGEKMYSIPFLPFVSGVAPEQIVNAKLILENITLYRLDEIQVRIVVDGDNALSFVIPNDAGYLQIAKDFVSNMQTTAKINDIVIPTLPLDFSQFDFLKNILLMNNLYLTMDKDDNKLIKLITYDDFYSQNLISKAQDLSSKIDLSQDISIKTNINLPSKHTFKYSEDVDFLNDSYQYKYSGDTFGSKVFVDGLGVGAEKKVELKFAATPPALIDNTDRLINFFTKTEISSYKKEKTNVKPRILYYSGVYSSSSYTIRDEKYLNNTTKWTDTILGDQNTYPLCSMYKFNSSDSIFGTQKPISQMNPVGSLMFGQPKLYFFNPSSSYTSLSSNLYNDYYRNQISEMTNGNLIVFTCSVYLNSFDINFISLRYPVFLNLGKYGSGYFKILTIDYGGDNKISKLTLQKIP